MKSVLLLCSSTDGQTRKICDRLRAILRDAGAAVTLTMIEDAGPVSPAAYEMAVIGARIRYGRTDARVIAYAGRHATRRRNACTYGFVSGRLLAGLRATMFTEKKALGIALSAAAWRPA